MFFRKYTAIIAFSMYLIGLIVAIIVGLVIVGGIKSIAKVTSKVVPVMCVLYLGACLIKKNNPTNTNIPEINPFTATPIIERPIFVKVSLKIPDDS